jgi:hypothetical protein
VQVRKEKERWARDQRQAAHHAMARPMAHQAASYAATGLSGAHLPSEVEAACDAASHQGVTALSLIALCGPPSVLDAARELRDAGEAMMGDHSVGAGRRHNAALLAFRAEAGTALGYESAQPLRNR